MINAVDISSTVFSVHNADWPFLNREQGEGVLYVKPDIAIIICVNGCTNMGEGCDEERQRSNLCVYLNRRTYTHSK